MAINNAPYKLNGKCSIWQQH